MPAYTLNRLLVGSIVLSIFTWNIRLFTFGSDIKLIHLVAISIISLACLKTAHFKDFWGLLACAALPLFSLLNVQSTASFSTSYVMWLLTIGFIFLGIPYLNRVFIVDDLKFAIRLSIYFMAGASAFGCFQFFANNFLAFDLYNFFGPIQAHAHYPNTILGIDRATSVFIEPSQFAWVCLFFLCLMGFLYLNRVDLNLPRWRRVFVIIASGVGVALSALGFIGALGLFTLLLLERQGQRGRKYAYVILGFAVVFGLVFLTGAARFLRLDTIAIEGTSGFQRVISPLLALLDVAEVYPLFGRGLGQQGIFDLRLPASEEITHNAVFGFWIVFGLLGGALVLTFLAVAYGKSLWEGRGALLLLFITGFMYLSTGAFIALEIPFLLSLASFAVTLVKREEEVGAARRQSDSPTQACGYPSSLGSSGA